MRLPASTGNTLEEICPSDAPGAVDVQLLADPRGEMSGTRALQNGSGAMSNPTVSPRSR